MYNATYLINYIPVEKEDLLQLDKDNNLYSSFEYIQSNVLPSTFPTVYNLYKMHKKEICDFIKPKIDNIDTSDLNGFGKIYDNINQLYKFNVFKPFTGEVDTDTELSFKNTFLEKCKDSDLVIIIGNIRNEQIEICNSIIITPEELSVTLKQNSTLIIGGFSKVFVNKLLSLRKDLDIIFSSTVTSWIDYEDIIVYLNYIDNYAGMSIENLSNYIGIGELKLRKSLFTNTQVSGDYLNSYDNGKRLITFLEGIYDSVLYEEIETKISANDTFNKDLVDYIIFIEAEMMCFPFTFVLGEKS